MIADVRIHEKSFGDKLLMSDVVFSIDDGEKVGLVGRNGMGKTTLFGILAGSDTDYTGDVIYRRGLEVVATAQEHHGLDDQTVMEYVLQGLPEYAELHQIITTYPETMGDDMDKIMQYTEALQRFDDRGFYQVEEKIERELENFQLVEGARSVSLAHRPLKTLSGGQKRLVEVIKVMHAQAGLALIDEPTNHMDYVAKQQFIDWMTNERTSKIAMLVITHDRDVLAHVDRIIELKDGKVVSYRGNYDAYLRQNAERTTVGMNDYEMIEKRIVNLKQKVLDYQRLKEKSRNPGTIQKFKRLENQSREELAELQQIEKPTFWIDRDSVDGLHYKAAGQYRKFKSRTIRMNIRDEQSRSKHVLVSARDLSLGYGSPLFTGVDIDLREGEAIELRGRNGAGKSTLIKALLAHGEPASNSSRHASSRRNEVAVRSLPSAELAPTGATVGPKQSSTGQEPTTPSAGLDQSGRSESDAGSPRGHDDSGATGARSTAAITQFAGTLTLDPHVRVGVYEQEVSPQYFDMTLAVAIERVYLDRGLSISDTKIRQLLADYLFTEADASTPVARLSGGQKARLQIIAMLANDPQLLILDEPTNHLDLPSIEELETALARYTGAVLYVSHDNYFRDKLGGEIIQIGE